MGAPQRFGNPVVSVSNIKYIAINEVIAVSSKYKNRTSKLVYF
jgi:hypothetical protein